MALDNSLHQKPWDGEERRAPDPAKRSGIRLNYEIGIGQLINAAVVASGLAIGIGSFINRAETTRADLRDLRVDVAARLASIQQNVGEEFRGVRADIANLPDVRAELVQLGRRMDQADSRADAQSRRLDQIGQLAIQTSAKVEAGARGTPPY